MPIASIDAQEVIPVPDGCEKAELYQYHLGALVESGGKAIWFSFAGGDDRLWTICMYPTECHTASAPLKTVAGELVIGNWTFKTTTRKAHDA